MTELLLVLRGTLVVGSILALVAFGYTIIYASSRVVNFAQGALLLAGAWFFFDAVDPAHNGFPPLVAVALASAGAAVVGVLIWVLGIWPLGRRAQQTDVSWILTTAALGLLLQNGFLADRYGTQPVSVEFIDSIGGWRGSQPVEGVTLDAPTLTLVMGTILLLAVLELVQHRTVLGRAFRSVAQDPFMASLVGISPRKVVVGSFALAGCLAALAGILIGADTGISPLTFPVIGIQAFVAAVLGGLGSTRGAIVGGYLIGLVRSVLAVWGPEIPFIENVSAWEQFVVFAVFLAVLAIRPTGLFGEPVVEKV